MKKLFAIIVSLFAMLIGNTKNAVHFHADDDSILDELQESFETMNFDGNFDSKKEQGMFNLRVQKVMNQIKTGSIRVPIASGGSDYGANSAVAQGLIASSKGDLNLIVTRKSTNIDGKLPYALFGTNDFDAGYISTLKGFDLPVGTTFAVSQNAGKVVFTYTQGANVDVIEVEFQGLNNYVSFLKGLNTTFFKTRYILYSIGDATQTSQLFNIINFGDISDLAKKAGNQLSPNSRKLPSDNLSDRVNLIFPETEINPDFSFVQQFNRTTMSISWDVFMSARYSKKG